MLGDLETNVRKEISNTISFKTTNEEEKKKDLQSQQASYQDFRKVKGVAV